LAPKLPDRRKRGLWTAVAIAGVALAVTLDDRYAGAIADGRQMSWTAVAIVESGEIGQARGRDFTWPREQGDSVSRYGMGMSLVQVPAAWLAPRVEARLGRGSSQPLFLVAPLIFVCLAAAAAGWIANELGLGPAAIWSAVLLTAIGSPLGAYAALDLSEPLQTAAVAVTLAAALASTGNGLRGRRALLNAGLSGFAAGIAVLTKSALIVVVPFALLPILAPTRGLRSRLMGMTAGLLPPLALWVYFELSRFGQLFASYAGEGFTHPVLDGVWRLLVGPNRGLALYFPTLAIGLLAAVLCWRSAAKRMRLALLGSLGTFGALLMLASAWWAWHGLWGWGPRLLVPAIPVLAASAAVLLDRWPRPALVSLVALSVVLNAPGLWQNAAPVTMFASSCDWPVADASFGQSLAFYARRTDPEGRVHVAPDQVLETVPQASPFLVYPWFARTTGREDRPEIARRLQSPPWIEARPDIRCGQNQGPDFVARLKRRPGWPAWGRGFSPDPSAPGFPGVYDEGLLDQVIRAEQLGRPEQALELARKLGRLAPGGDADAHIMESLRLLGRRNEAAEYLGSLPTDRRSEPRINLVLALFERDAGNEQLAQQFLASVASSFPGTPAVRAVSAPLATWPRDLNGMLASETDQAGLRK
jgi:hypothetical protein